MYGQPNYYTSPAMQTAQQRLQMMESQYPQFASPMPNYTQNPMYQAPQQPQGASPMLRGRPVSNEEEANAAMIDFDGSMFVFPDNAHGKIYTKQLGIDGNIIFKRYALEQPSVDSPSAPISSGDPLEEYVKKEDLKAELAEMKAQLSGLEQRLFASHKNKGGAKE